MPLILPCCSRLLRAPGDEVGTHSGLPDHCLQRFPYAQHGHVRLGAPQSPAGQARQSERLDLRPQWPVTVAAGKVSRAFSQMFAFLLCFRHGDGSLVRFCIHSLLFLSVTILTLPRANGEALKAQQVFLSLDASTSPSFPLLMNKNGSCRSVSLNSPHFLREMSLFSSLLSFRGSLEKHIYFQLCAP